MLRLSQLSEGANYEGDQRLDQPGGLQLHHYVLQLQSEDRHQKPPQRPTEGLIIQQLKCDNLAYIDEVI